MARSRWADPPEYGTYFAPGIDTEAPSELALHLKAAPDVPLVAPPPSAAIRPGDGGVASRSSSRAGPRRPLEPVIGATAAPAPSSALAPKRVDKASEPNCRRLLVRLDTAARSLVQPTDQCTDVLL